MFKVFTLGGQSKILLQSGEERSSQDRSLQLFSIGLAQPDDAALIEIIYTS